MLWRVLAALLCVQIYAAEERIWVQTKVNNQPAKIFLDTGAGEFYLFRDGAERLGLKMPESDRGADWKMFWAGERIRVETVGFKGRLRPAIAEPPSFLNVGDADGFLGWNTIRSNIVKIDASRLAVFTLPKLPADAKSWTRLRVRTQKGILMLETKDKKIIIIDTGATSGVAIPKEAWAAWKAANPDKPISTEKVAMPSTGIFSRERSRADTITVGPITFRDVDIAETEAWSQGLAKGRHAATLGLFALKRLDLVIDGKNGWAYLRPH